MKQIEVVAAIIHKDGKYFATQRGYGEFEGLWEFPGGKIEENETLEGALIREIREELTIDIAVEKFFCTVEYDYPSFHLTMHCYLCYIVQGTPQLLEHKSARWLDKEALDSVEWLPADKAVIDLPIANNQHSFNRSEIPHQTCQLSNHSQQDERKK